VSWWRYQGARMGLRASSWALTSALTSSSAILGTTFLLRTIGGIRGQRWWLAMQQRWFTWRDNQDPVEVFATRCQPGWHEGWLLTWLKG
jgi:hypothetical protein